MIPEKQYSLFERAKAARDRAYAPYSQWKVGASVRMSDGRIYEGCNVENSSYGATVCAERVAIFKAQSESHARIEEIMIMTQTSPPSPPCGMCLQVMAEFASPQTEIHLVNPQGEFQNTRFSDLMPRAFTPSHLLDK